MDNQLSFAPEEVFDEVSNILDSLELCGGWDIISFESGEILKQRKDFDDSLIFSSEVNIDRLPHEISEAILDIEIRKQWDKYLVNIDTLNQWGKNLKIIYMQQKYAWPLSDRDFVLVQGIANDLNNKITIGWKSVELEFKPLTPGFVRGDVQFSGYVITKISENSSHVSFIEKLGPNGSIPLFLWKIIEKNSLKTLGSLKNFLMS